MSTTLELQPPAAPEQAATPLNSLTQIAGKTTAPLSQSPSPSTGQETPKSEQDAVHEFGQLPPTDTGKDAWLFLAACFTLETLVWGFPFAFGVFQSYYNTHEPFAGSGSIAVIGTCAMGIMYLDTPFITAFLRLYPKFTRWAPAAGILVMCVSLAASSFSQSVGHLILTQGILYALGGSVCYVPAVLYLDEWFVKRKGLAFGIMWSGTGLGGVAIPLLLEFWLGRYGFRTTLRIWSGVLFALTAPLVYFLKPRLPVSASTYKSVFNISFVFTRTFLLYQLTNIVEALGYFLPGIYLPSYASEVLGAGPFPSALTLLIANVGAVVGCVAMGWLVDRLHITTCLAISAAGTAVATFLLWGLGTNLATLYMFCIFYGLFGGAYSSAWPGMMRQIATVPGDSGRSFDPVLVLSFLATGRGIGNIASGPLSEALIKGQPWRGEALAGYGSGYGALIAFTGITAVVSGGAIAFRRLGWLP